MKKAVTMNKEGVIGLIEAEKSAIETYKHIFEMYAFDPSIDELKDFSAQHKKATRFLKEEANAFGIYEFSPSAFLCIWANANEQDKREILRLLKESEVYGLEQYKEVARNKNTPDSIKRQIKEEFIPNQKMHIRKINDLMCTVET